MNGRKRGMTMQPEIIKYTAGMEIKPGIYDGMPEEVYRAAAGLNFSTFKDFIAPHGSPGLYKALHISKAIVSDDDKEAFIVGRGIHEKTAFGTFDVTKYPEVFLSGKKGAPTEKTIANSAAVMNCSTMLHAVPSFQHIHANSYIELAIFAIDPITGLLLKCRVDYLEKSLSKIWDLKSSGDTEKLIKWNWMEWDYQYQDCHYSYVTELACGADPKREFGLIVVAKEFPHKVDFVGFANAKTDPMPLYKLELKHFAECMRTGQWYDEIRYIQN